MTDSGKNVFTSYVVLCHCIIWPSFLLDCFVKIWTTCENFWTNGSPMSPLPPSKKLPCGCKKFKYQPREFLCTVFLHFSMLTILRMFLQDTILDYSTRMHLWCESHPFIWIADSELLVMLSNNWIEVSCNTNKIIIRWQAI